MLGVNLKEKEENLYIAISKDKFSKIQIKRVNIKKGLESLKSKKENSKLAFSFDFEDSERIIFTENYFLILKRNSDLVYLGGNYIINNNNNDNNSKLTNSIKKLNLSSDLALWFSNYINIKKSSEIKYTNEELKIVNDQLAILIKNKNKIYLFDLSKTEKSDATLIEIENSNISKLFVVNHFFYLVTYYKKELILFILRNNKLEKISQISNNNAGSLNLESKSEKNETMLILNENVFRYNENINNNTISSLLKVLIIENDGQIIAFAENVHILI